METQNDSYELIYSNVYIKHIDKHKKSGQKQVLKKILSLLIDIKTDPYIRIGKPEELKYYGERVVYSREITKKHRLVYEIFEEEKIVDILSAYGHYNEKKKDEKTLF